MGELTISVVKRILINTEYFQITSIAVVFTGFDLTN